MSTDVIFIVYISITKSHTTVIISACQLYGLISPYHLDKKNRKEGLCCKPGKGLVNSWRTWFVATYLSSYCILITKLDDNLRLAITLFLYETNWIFLQQTGWLLPYRLHIASFWPSLSLSLSLSIYIYIYILISQKVLFCSILFYVISVSNWVSYQKSIHSLPHRYANYKFH